MRLLLVTIFILGTATGAVAQKKTCDYAGQAYSLGATLCECPSLKAENLNWQHEHGHITSRRLVCSSEQTWEDTKTTCIDADMTTDTEKVYNQNRDHFCPRLPVNFAEIQKAVSQETDKLIAAAPPSAIVSIVEAICRRFRLDAPCKAILEALTSSEAQPK